MPAITSCPSDLELQRISQGQGTAADIDAFASHFEHCQACADRLETSLKHDTLTDAMRNQSTLVESLNDPAVQSLLDRLLKMQPVKQATSPAPALPANQTHTVRCSCGTVLQIKAEMLGRNFECPRCGQGGNSAGPQLAHAPKAPLAQLVPSDLTPAPSLTGALPHLSAAHSDATLGSAVGNESAPSYDFLAPPQAADEIGRLGIYRVLEVLGYGGMGIVFKAEDPHLKRMVALKAMLPAMAAKASSKERFLREARAAAAINHDNIVSIYQVGEDRGVPFLAMEFLEGQPLDQWLKDKDKLPLADILRIGRETAQGLAAAHKRGLIHRDIKPGNLWLEIPDNDDLKNPMISGDTFAFRSLPSSRAAAPLPRVKILDFGLARSRDEQTQLTQSGTIVGTPAYMAPEQANGGAIDARADLFSLGCILYRMSTGSMPFKGTDTLSLLMSLAMDHPTAPIERNATMPRPLSDLIMHLLAKKPDARPESAQAVVAAIAQLEEDLHDPIRSKPTPKRRPVGSPFRPGRRLVAIAAGLVAAAVLLAGAVYFVQTPKGTVRVEINDPSVEAVLTSDGAIIKGVDKTQDVKVVAGEQGLKIKRGDLEFETDKFVLKKGEIVTVKVELLPGRIQVVQGDKVIGTRDLPLAGKVASPADPAIIRGPFVSLDQLDQAKIPEDERYPWQPKELVAVIGSSRAHSWAGSSSSTLIWSPDTKTIATPRYNGLVLWDPITLRPKGRLPGVPERAFNSFHVAAYSPDGKMLAAALDGQIQIFEVDGNEAKLRTKIRNKDELLPTSVMFSPDSKTLAAGWSDFKMNHFVQLLDTSAKEPREKAILKGHRGEVMGLAFTPDGRTLATCDYGERIVRLWDLSPAEPKIKMTLPPLHKDSSPRVAFALDGKILVTEGVTGGSDTCLWNISGAQPELKSILVTFWPIGRAVSPNGTRLAISTGVGLAIYDIREPAKPSEIVKLDEGAHSYLAFSPDNKHLLMSHIGETNPLTLFDLDDKTVSQRPEPIGYGAGCQQAVLAPDGRTLATAGGKKQVHLWDMTGASPRLRAELQMPDDVRTIAFTSDNKTLAVSYRDCVSLWNLNKPQPEELRTFRVGYVCKQLVFTPDGKIMGCSGWDDAQITLWDISGAEAKQGILLPKSIEPAFSPDGKTLLTLRRTKNSVNEWEVVEYERNGAELKELVGRKSDPLQLDAVTFSPDRTLLATTSPDQGMPGAQILKRSNSEFKSWHTCGGRFHPRHITFGPDNKTVAYWEGPELMLWDTEKSIRLKSWILPGKILQVSFPPDGRHLILGNSDGTAYVLRLSDPDKKP